jgi:uncharacterized membrane protein HdeD (DUF308 family)
VQLVAQAIRYYRWMLLFRGILAILFGILAIAWPGITLIALVYLFGAYAFIDGVVEVVAALRHTKEQGWGLLLVEGIVSVLAGVVAFAYPGITALVFLYLLAAWAVVTGITEIVAAFSLPLGASREWLLGLAGVASILFGILIAFQPKSGLLIVVWLIGIYAVVFGALLIGRYFQTRSLQVSAGS